MRIPSLLLSVSLACSGSQVLAQTLQEKKTTVLDAACRDRSTASACFFLSGWHWLRKARVVIDPGLTSLQVSSTIYALTLMAKWVAGEVPAIEYILVVSRTGLQVGATAVAAGGAVIIGGTLASAGGLLLSLTTPAGQGDEIQPRCDDILAQYDSAEGLEKLLKLPPAEFEMVSRCIPKDSQLRNFLQNSIQNAREFELRMNLN